MKPKLSAAFLGVACFSFGAIALADDAKDMPGMAPTTMPSASDTPTTQPINKLCPVTKEDIDPSITTDYMGKKVAFCCPSCVAKFKADPEKYMKDLK